MNKKIDGTNRKSRKVRTKYKRLLLYFFILIIYLIISLLWFNASEEAGSNFNVIVLIVGAFVICPVGVAILESFSFFIFKPSPNVHWKRLRPPQSRK